MIFDNLYKIMRIKIKFLFLLGDLRAVARLGIVCKQPLLSRAASVGAHHEIRADGTY